MLAKLEIIDLENRTTEYLPTVRQSVFSMDERETCRRSVIRSLISTPDVLGLCRKFGGRGNKKPAKRLDIVPQFVLYFNFGLYISLYLFTIVLFDQTLNIMEKREIVYALFGSFVCLGAIIGAYLIGRSTKKFVADEEEKEKLRKELSSNH